MRVRRSIWVLSIAFLLTFVPDRPSGAAVPDASFSALLDINTATPQQLKALPGFGDVYVRRVIAGRPYEAKNQLVTRGVLPASAYAKIAALIVAHHPAR